MFAVLARRYAVRKLLQSICAAGWFSIAARPSPLFVFSNRGRSAPSTAPRSCAVMIPVNYAKLIFKTEIRKSVGRYEKLRCLLCYVVMCFWSAYRRKWNRNSRANKNKHFEVKYMSFRTCIQLYNICLYRLVV